MQEGDLNLFGGIIMKTYFTTMWKLGLYLLAEYWWFYLILTIVLTVLVLKYEKKIVSEFQKMVFKLNEMLLDYKESLEQR